MITIPFQWNDIPLLVHKPVIHYLGGVSPQLEWDCRGLSGYEEGRTEKDKLLKARKDAETFIQTPEGQKKLQDFLSEAIQIFQKIMLQDNQWFQKEFGTKKFIFVVGALRTGGTYLYSELCKIHGIPWEKFPQGMSHDGIPQNGIAIQLHHPALWIRFSFEFAQWLAYIKREYQDHPVVIHKNSSYAHCLNTLDAILGNQAEYIITVRHPTAVSDSINRYLIEGLKGPTKDSEKELPFWKNYVKSRDPLQTQKWNQLSYQHKTDLYWLHLYQDIARLKPIKGQCQALSYGTDYTHFLKERAQELSLIDYKPHDFYINEKDKLKKGTVVETIQKIWEQHHMHWPLF